MMTSNSREVSHDGSTYSAIKEGSGTILTPPTEKSQSVFYNPIQRFNRDLSVLAIKVFGQDTLKRRPNKASTGQKRKRDDVAPLRILDALSASGLRALRYAHEIPQATSIVANDMDPGATKSIKRNIEFNAVDDKVTVQTGNAIGLMYRTAHPIEGHGPRYDVIDLDPYGTAAPFIDAAVQALRNGGMLCVTCTDSGVFASCGYSEKTFSQYGGLPVRGLHSHEAGLRLILQCIATSAARYGLAIEPLLSLSIDFYARVFVRIKKSPAEVKFLSSKTMLVYSCDSGCGAWQIQYLGRTQQSGQGHKHSMAQAPSADRNCDYCKSKTHISGPMWGGSLHNAAFVERVLAEATSADEAIYGTKARLRGVLDTALNELAVIPSRESLWPQAETISSTPVSTLDPHPFFFIPSTLSKVIKCVSPPEAMIRGALRHAGYRVTKSHCRPGSLKTDAPWDTIWEIMREWTRQHKPIKEGALAEGSPGWVIMNRPEVDGETKLKVVFDEQLGKQEKKFAIWQDRKDWGPMKRAKAVWEKDASVNGKADVEVHDNDAVMQSEI
ncbi:TRM-domain-containing protein [Piedraia hortae CBS 480.64]|uniref:tRNA (guanine(26)-N(2))-dimethyltransferase n=1 Tax=Piedraia hortae CBS 480.64 TaxID=1314780 RepID=A0A6A7C0S8_9PEZI|nr:TRM-domain-containing protein [Piedraia hortae CBS 480.64]